MQSETGNHLPISQAPTPGTSTSQNVPRTGHTDPMAFLNAMANDPVPGIDPQKISNNVAADTAPIPKEESQSKPTEPLTVPLASKPDVTPKFFEEVSGDAKVKSDTPEEKKVDAGEEGELEELTNPGAEHFKRLRQSHSELKKNAAELKREKEELAEKLEKYTTGEIVPEVLQQKEEEIARLSKYEKLVNLKGSKEYQEKFVAPIQAATTKLKEMFAEYGVPAEELDKVVNKAINTNNRVDLNRFLQEHFGNDELGAIEAKGLVIKAKEIQEQAREAEKEPVKMLEELQRENEAVTQVRETHRKNTIVNSAKSSWVESLEEIRQEGQLVELIHKEDDPEFNQHYPDRILPQAAKEYGKIVTELGNLGAKDLPKPLAKALAKMVLLAHSTGVAIETRNRAMEGIEELTTNLSRKHTMLRPPVGGGVARAANGAPMPSKPMTAEQEARGILNSVLAKK